MSVLIFLGGEKPSPELSRQAADRARFIIAADSGYEVCRENGIAPQVITGDFDSITNLPDAPGIEVIQCTEQDATDFEKALRHVPADVAKVEILGGTGLRSDHFLTNLLIASNRPQGQAVVFQDDTQSIHRITPECPFEGTVPAGATVSLIPFSECDGVTTRGLHWNLQDVRMGPAHQLGQSNRAEKNTITASIRKGTLFLVVNHFTD